MQTIKNGYRGLSLLFDLNWDRFISVGTLIGALFLGMWLMQLLQYAPLVERI